MQFQRSIPGGLTLIVFKIKAEWIVVASVYHPASSLASFRVPFQTQLKAILADLPANSKINSWR